MYIIGNGSLPKYHVEATMINKYLVHAHDAHDACLSAELLTFRNTENTERKVKPTFLNMLFMLLIYFYYNIIHTCFNYIHTFNSNLIV